MTPSRPSTAARHGSMDLVFDADPEDLKVFLAEAQELLALLDTSILTLEREGPSPNLLQDIFRAAHTLKGSSAAIGHQRMADLTHLMESLLDRLRRGEIEIDTAIIDLLLDCLDALRVLQEEAVTLRSSDQDFSLLVQRLEAAVVALPQGGRAQPVGQPSSSSPSMPQLSPDEDRRLSQLRAEGVPVYLVSIEIEASSPLPSARCLQAVMELSAMGELVACAPPLQAIESEPSLHQVRALVATTEEPQSLRYQIGSMADVAAVEAVPYPWERLTHPSIPARGEPPAGESGTAASAPRQSTQTVRIDVERLDKLMNLVGELVIDRTRLTRLAAEMETRLAHDELAEQLGETALHIARLTDELQQEIMKSRMVPVESVFSRFPRLVRDLAQKVGKKVEFVVEGQNTELDRSVIQEIGDPLIHLLRNAVDHGIEEPAERTACGKTETGQVRLQAHHEESYIVIAVEDDGRGIDTEKVKATAVAKGIVSAEYASHMGEREALNLIFASGLSTAEQVTELSGRGVGMDIVRTNIEKLGGSVSLSTQRGSGSRFTIKLPVTLAILPALLVGVGEGVYAIPLTSVSETLRVDAGSIQPILGTEAIQVRGNVLPLLQLRSVFEQRATGRGDGKVLVVSVRFGGHEVGLVVDSLLGQQEVVIKSLGGYLGNVRGLSGATILGDGRVGLIVDVPTLVELAIRDGVAARTGQQIQEAIA